MEQGRVRLESLRERPRCGLGERHGNFNHSLGKVIGTKCRVRVAI